MLKYNVKYDTMLNKSICAVQWFSVAQSNLFSIFILDILDTLDSDPDGNMRIHWLPSLPTHSIKKFHAPGEGQGLPAALQQRNAI